MSWADKLLFQPVDPRPFALVRIVVGLVSFLNFLAYAPHLTFFYSDQGFYPRDLMNRFQNMNYPVSLLYLSGEPWWVFTVFALALAISLLYAAGVKTRLTGPLLWLFLSSFVNRNVLVVDGSFTLLLQLMIPLMFADTGAIWSWDARHRKGEAPKVHSWLGFALRFQLGLIYFVSGIYKLMGAEWVNGNAVKFALANPSWRRFDFDGLLSLGPVDWSLTLFGMLTPWWELTFPLLVLFPYTRALALGFGLFLHGSQWFTINTAYFVPVLLALYTIYLPPEVWERVKPTNRA